MRSSRNDSNLFSFEKFGTDILDRAVTPSNKSGGCAVVGVAEIDARTHFGGCGNRGNDRIAIIAVERSNQCVEPAHLNRAGDLEFFANQPGEIHVETDGGAI